MLAAAGVGGAGEAGDGARRFPVSLGEPAVIEVKPHGVAWSGNTYHPLRFGKAQFRLDADGRLRGAVAGGKR